MKKVVAKKARKQSEFQEISSLRVALASLKDKLSENKFEYRLFADLPISSKTKMGLESSHFFEMTEIQQKSIPVILSGNDIIGAAETGSGKTLAFLVPMLERLYVEGWTTQDGLGGLIISPTRELAIQTFQVLRKIGSRHTFSAGLIIGGKDINAEREAIARMNILVATPGRLLQHMDQAAGFEWGNLQMLVLDEADRILDLGFSRTVDAILDSLPRCTRQTLLFSATQTSSVQSLARLSLSSPTYIHTSSLSKSQCTEGSQESKLKTPSTLKQFVLFTPLQNKIDHLWSFVKQHTQEKTIVFVSSCKQVRFFYEAYCRLQPGIPILHLHGKQKQHRRMEVFADFCRRKSCLLIATDIAARGLDFPAVDWVLQLDCPEDAETYVHRVGRTARYNAAGSSLLYLMESEKCFFKALVEDYCFPISFYSSFKAELDFKPRLSIKGKLQALCSQLPELKHLAQKSIVSYVRSLYLNQKSNPSLEGLDFDELAYSLGLAGAPKLRFLGRQNDQKNECRDLKIGLNQNDVDDSECDVVSEHGALVEKEKRCDIDTEDGEDELLRVKRVDADIELNEFELPIPKMTSRRDILKTKKKFRLKHPTDHSQRLIFDSETGVSKEKYPFDPESEFDRSEAQMASSTYFGDTARKLAVVDQSDKERAKNMQRQKRLEKRYKLRKAQTTKETIQ